MRYIHEKSDYRKRNDEGFVSMGKNTSPKTGIRTKEKNGLTDPMQGGEILLHAVMSTQIN